MTYMIFHLHQLYIIEMTMRHLDYLSHILVGEIPIRFNQHQNRLYLDMDFQNAIVQTSS